MTPDESRRAVSGCAPVVAYTMQGEEVARGVAVAYSVVPTVTIEQADGSRSDHRHDLCRLLPPEQAPPDDTRQVVMLGPIYEWFEAEVKRRGMSLGRIPSDPDDLPTYTVIPGD